MGLLTSASAAPHCGGRHNRTTKPTDVTSTQKMYHVEQTPKRNHCLLKYQAQRHLHHQRLLDPYFHLCLTDSTQCSNIQYVGETGNTLQTRFYHQSDIKITTNTVVARHFNGIGLGVPDLRGTAIEQVKSLAPQTKKQPENSGGTN